MIVHLHNFMHCCVIFFILASALSCYGYDSNVAKYFLEHKVVPNVIAFPPKEGLKVTYGDQEVKFGNELTPTQVKSIPSVKWTAEPTSFYTLIMTDPDAPSRKDPKNAEWHHWIVVNIPGNDLSRGETLFEYVGAGSPPKTGLHRYTFLVYKQQHQQLFDEPRLTNRSVQGRTKRSVTKFAAKHKLGQPIAGNFFQAKYDDYVPILNNQLGI